MRRVIGVLGVMALTAGTPAGTRAASSQTSDAQLITNERALYDAVAKNDPERFRSLVLSDGFWATPSGWVPMGPLAGGLSAFEVPKWAIENPRVVWTDGNSALLLYIRTGGGLYGDRPFAPMTLASTLWTKRDGKWVAVYHQESADIP
jgi:hypothetical protein